MIVTDLFRYIRRRRKLPDAIAQSAVFSLVVVHRDRSGLGEIALGGHLRLAAEAQPLHDQRHGLLHVADG